MDITIDQQVALDKALVPHASRLKIGKSNFQLRLDIKSKESTLQVVYDVLKLTPFYKVFLVTADVPKIYMQELWATATVQHYSIRFKMNNKKRIVNLDYFREMLQICPIIPNQQFDELPFEEEIIAFLKELGHSGEIKMITDTSKHSTGGAIFPVKLTNEAIRNSESYKEYYAIASGAEPPTTKASVRKKQGSSDTTVLPPTAKGKRLKTSAKVDKPAKEKQPAKSSKTKGLIVLSEVALTEAEQMKLATKRSLTQTYISHASGSGAVEGTGIIPGVPDVPTYEYDDEEISWKSSEDDDDDEEEISDHDDDVDDQSDDNDQDDKQTDSDNDVQTPSQVENTDDEDNDEDSHGMNVKGDKGANEEDEANELYRDVNINLAGRDVQMADVQTTQVIEDTHMTLTPVNPEGQQQSSSVSSRFVLNMLNPSPDTRIDSIFESTLRVDIMVMTTAELPLLSTTTLPPPSIPIISHVQQTPAPSPANKIIKEQVKVQVSKILPKIEKTVYEQLEAKVLTRSSNSSKTSHVVVADLSEFELKKILIDKMESNKSIHRLYEQKKDFEMMRIKTKNPSLDQTGGPREDEQERNQSQPVHQKKRHLRHLATHGRIQPWISNLAKKAESRISFNELIDTPVDFSAFVMNQLKVDTLTPELLAGPTYELMKGSSKSLVELEFFLEAVYKATTDQLDWNNPERQQYPHYLLKPLPLIPNSRGLTKTKATDYGHIKWIEDLVPRTMWSQVPVSYDKHALWGISHWGRKRQQFYGFAVNRESDRDVYSKRRIIVVTELQIEGDFKRLRIQDIEDMLLLLVQGKLTSLTVDERFALNVNLTKSDTYRLDLKRKEAYTTYSNPIGFIYKNKDKQNRLMRIDELHKFSDGTLNDVRTALDDRLMGIRMQYLS
uniref:Uncharacterized protein n=1 Tax=Tanacetum cinerariifolium TaxID=118510 RepID=A0A699GQ65_TANCI|nr:hypothetical protein [Tanacetum cinerariifolium]